MSADEPDCVEHEWVLDTVAVNEKGGAAIVRRCNRCDAVSYEPSAADDPNRRRLS